MSVIKVLDCVAPAFDWKRLSLPSDLPRRQVHDEMQKLEFDRWQPSMTKAWLSTVVGGLISTDAGLAFVRRTGEPVRTSEDRIRQKMKQGLGGFPFSLAAPTRFDSPLLHLLLPRLAKNSQPPTPFLRPSRDPHMRPQGPERQPLRPSPSIRLCTAEKRRILRTLQESIFASTC